MTNKSMLRQFTLIFIGTTTSAKIGLFTVFTYPECRAGCNLMDLFLSVLIDPINWLLIFVLSITNYFLVSKLNKIIIINPPVIYLSGLFFGLASFLIYP